MPTKSKALIGRSQPPPPMPRVMPRGNWIDRAIMAVWPSWGIRRLQARATAFAYEAAGSGRRTSSWARNSADANAAVSGSLIALRELSRDLRRNNGWARRGIQVIKNNTVGWGIMPRPTNARGVRMQAALDVWNAWSSSTACDFDGRLTFSGLQRLIMETVVESGEALVLFQPAGKADDLPVPLRLQVLEPDYLSPINDGVITDAGNVTIQGIEFDAKGRRVAYYLYTRHPGSGLAAVTIKSAFATVRVPADRVLHVYNVERPGQARGVPWLASAIARLQDFDEFEDAELVKQKVAACFAAFVTTADGIPTTIGEPAVDEERVETLEPGTINHLTPGEDVKFGQPSAVIEGGFTTRNLRRVAASLGVTYEDLTFDFSQVNFSSARMGRLAHYQNVHDWRFNMLVPQFCDGVWRRVMQLAADLQDWQVIPDATWVPPPMPMLEPDKEGLAYSRLVRSGIMTLPQAIREQGYDPGVHLQEIADANAQLDKLGIVLDSDPRKTNTAGALQVGSSPSKPGDASSGAKPPPTDGSDDDEAATPPNGKANGKKPPQAEA